MTLAYDPAVAVAFLADADKTLGALIQRVGPFTLTARVVESPFQALLQAIVQQQLSGKAAASIYGRILALFPEASHLDPQCIQDCPDERLRSAGLSRAKVAAIKDLTAKTLDTTVPSLAQLQRMDDAEIIARLTTVRGIGRWTVEMLLLFHLGRPDVLPVNDLGVRKGFKLAYRQEHLPSPAAVGEYGERWRPYRSVASWYLWRAVETAV